MKVILFTCIRCGYETPKKGNIRHHFNRKKICPSSLNNIELTDEIKDEILRSRIYHIPKPVKETKEKADKIIKYDPYKGVAYIFYTRASKNINEYVYKIGKSHDHNERKGGYMKGGNYLLVLNVKDRHLCENIVLAHFNREFTHRGDYGREFFEGDIFEMVLLMKEILADQIEEIAIDFDL
jgi:hypothetical protein